MKRVGEFSKREPISKNADQEMDPGLILVGIFVIKEYFPLMDY